MLSFKRNNSFNQLPHKIYNHGNIVKLLEIIRPDDLIILNTRISFPLKFDKL